MGLLGDIGEAAKTAGNYIVDHGKEVGGLLQGGAAIYGAVQQNKQAKLANELANRQLSLAEQEYNRGVAKEDKTMQTLNDAYSEAFGGKKTKSPYNVFSPSYNDDSTTNDHKLMAKSLYQDAQSSTGKVTKPKVLGLTGSDDGGLTPYNTLYGLTPTSAMLQQ